MIGEIAPGVSYMRFSESRKETKNDVVENGQHFWRVAHAQLGVILLHGHVSPMMHAVLIARQEGSLPPARLQNRT